MTGMLLKWFSIISFDKITSESINQHSFMILFIQSYNNGTSESSQLNANSKLLASVKFQPLSFNVYKASSKIPSRLITASQTVCIFRVLSERHSGDI